MKKKIIILIFVLFFFVFISSCKSNDFSYDELDKITYKNILSLNDEYIVVCYQTNCPNCEDLKPDIQKYNEYSKKKKTMPLYGLSINLSINKDICLLKEETYPLDMLNTTDYQKIKVRATPSILVIKNHTLVKVISDYNTEKPVTDTRNYLNSLM